MSAAECPNCGWLHQPTDRFCAQCGQAVIEKESLRSIGEQFLGDYFTFDSKIVRSLVPLLVRPGFLTAEYLAGRRARYIPPLRMYIFISIFFFLIIGSKRQLSGSTMLEAQELQDHLFWDHFFTTVLPRLFFLFLPLFAALVTLFFRSRPISFVKALVLSAHYHAFIFLIFTLYGLASRAMAGLHVVQVNTVLISVVLAYALVYLWLALRLTHPRPLLRHSAAFVGLLATYTVLLAGSAVLAAWLLQ